MPRSSTSVATTVRLRAAAGRSWGTCSGRDGRGRPRCRCRRARSGGSAWSRWRAGARGARASRRRRRSRRPRARSRPRATPRALAARVAARADGGGSCTRPRSATSGSSALSTSVVPPRARGHHRRPAVGDRLQLAVAVELVAEQVAEQHRARLELLDDRAEPELVDLEEAEVARQRAAAAAAGARPARSRSRPPCSPRRGCGRAARRCARGCSRPSPRSSSCRWWR